MKTLFRWLLILIFATAQIPVLPLFALMTAEIDKGHRICLSEENGVFTLVLRHDRKQAEHLEALNALLFVAANHDDTQDHVMHFVHSTLSFESSQSSFHVKEIAANEAWIEGDEIIAIIGDHPPVSEEIISEWSRTDQTILPLGLSQTVLLV